MAGGCGRMGKKRGATARDSLVGHSAIKLGFQNQKKKENKKERRGHSEEATMHRKRTDTSSCMRSRVHMLVARARAFTRFVKKE